MSQTHTLPDDPVFAFAPSYDFEDEVQQIRIVFQDVPGYIPTAMVALTLQDAEDLCDKLNRRLGLDREAWSTMLANSMRASEPSSDLH